MLALQTRVAADAGLTGLALLALEALEPFLAGLTDNASLPLSTWQTRQALRALLPGRSRLSGLAQRAGHACRTLMARLTRQAGGAG